MRLVLRELSTLALTNISVFAFFAFFMAARGYWLLRKLSGAPDEARTSTRKPAVLATSAPFAFVLPCGAFSTTGACFAIPPGWTKWLGFDVLASAIVLILLSILWSAILRRRLRGQTALLREWTRREVALREKYEELFENANDIIFTADLDWKLTSINKAGEDLTGFERAEVLGSDLMQFIPDEYRGVAQTMLRKKIQGGMTGSTFLEVCTKDGRRLPLEVNSHVIYEDSKAVGVQGIARDITARKRAEEEQEIAKEAAESASRAKGEFLANMSHEIRTPLNGILGMTELALGTNLTEEQHEYLTMVKSSGEALLTVINDILDFSKIEAGRLDLNPLDFALRDSLGDALKSLAHRAHEKGLELTLHVGQEVPQRVVGDPTRLRQIIVNLVGNAIKFTERGEVVLHVRVESKNPEALWLRFRITDTGIGIPSEKHNLIFAPFTQADSSATRRHGGTGLGLAICFQLVALMDGRLWMESEVGRGSHFYFTARFGVSTSKGESIIPGQGAKLQGLAVLVVDDNVTNRRVLEEMLRGWRMMTAVADGGWTGLAAMERARDAGRPFPLVLIDAQMPDLDGFSLAERIKQDSTLAGATIMMLTSVGRRGDAARCRELGIAAYLHKPIKEWDLIQAILLALEPHPAGGEGPEVITSHALRERLPKLRILLAEDDLVNREVAERVLSKAGHAVTAVHNGDEALAALGSSGYNAFDAVLMDVQMPGMDGVTATSVIRQKERETGTHLPIIAMTAHAMKGDKARFLAAGMDGYIAKPVRAQELVKAIEGIFPDSGENSGEDDLREQALPVFDWNYGLAQVEGDRDLFRDLLRLFEKEAPALLERVRQAIVRKDALEIGQRVHALKGSVGNFGAERALKAALRLEQMARRNDLTHAEEGFRDLEWEIGRVLSSIKAQNSEVR